MNIPVDYKASEPAPIEAASPTTKEQNLAVFVKLPSSMDQLESETFFVVTDSTLVDLMIERGYKRVKIQHCTSIHALPDKIPSTTSQLSKIPLYQRPAPTTITLPSNGKVPCLTKGDVTASGKRMTVAQKIVQVFEEKVIDEESNTVYSPLKLWTHMARKKVGLKDSNFTVRCNCYYAIRKLMSDLDPADVTDTVCSLKRKAIAATEKERRRSTAHGQTFQWFEACLEIYNALYDMKDQKQHKF